MIKIYSHRLWNTFSLVSTLSLTAVIIAGCQPADDAASAPSTVGTAVQTSSSKPTPLAVSVEKYKLAERFLAKSKSQFILNDDIKPHWLPADEEAVVKNGEKSGAGERFWYLRQLPEGQKEFVLVDAASGDKSPAFNHASIAEAINQQAKTQSSANAEASSEGDEKANDELTEEIITLKDERISDSGSTANEASAEPKETVTATSLPFDAFTYNDKGGIDFQAGVLLYSCTSDACETTEPSAPPFLPTDTPSPDGKWAIYVKDHNIWLKSADGNTDKALTTDGVDGWGYGGQIGTSTSLISMQRMMGGVPAQVIWSPDSSRVLTQYIDEREVKPLSLIEYAPRDGSIRPRTHTMRYAFAGDEVKPTGEFVVFDVPTGARIDIDYEPIELAYASLTGPALKEVWWSKDASTFGFIHRKPYARGYSLHHVDLASGKVSARFNRSSESTAPPGMSIIIPPLVKELADGGMIFSSDETGYVHLYLRDVSGNISPITEGDWNVLSITQVDEQAGRVYFSGSQSELDGNPYYFFPYSVNLDGTDLKNLSPAQVNHLGSLFNTLLGVGVFSPSGNYFIDSWSTSNQPGQTELRNKQGELITILETVNISALEKDGFVMPQPFEVTASDGETKLYGTLFFPSDFDASKSYPIVDSIYPGPQIWRDLQLFSSSVSTRSSSPQALAELGFIVFTVNGRGTPGRSSNFHYPDGVNLLDKAGYLEDHVTTIEQLAQRHAYIDTDKVGIYGWSGGGYASTHAMFSYPDFFKVAVSGAGNHDPRTYLPVWGESYLGPDSGETYLAGSNAHLAANLTGKLLLVHGALDDNVHPANTMAVVQALIDANRDFDLLILPNSNHSAGEAEDYFQRREWDYFVTHLLGATPPKNFAIGGGN